MGLREAFKGLSRIEQCRGGGSRPGGGVAVPGPGASLPPGKGVLNVYSYIYKYICIYIYICSFPYKVMIPFFPINQTTTESSTRCRVLRRAGEARHLGPTVQILRSST